MVLTKLEKKNMSGKMFEESSRRRKDRQHTVSGACSLSINLLPLDLPVHARG